ncbi:AraC family transcriptional regulator [Deminuibacter soli]|uniref:AraC family transcriptional regulator n=1 Tax=Deminuibacter soli TaxID=2291815 RepID=A0A3E1NKA0_9BACT|nr:AraC family transcriptional regulator [Deminuibacter soli]RFM28301.1 AraC family transcriptional regulator [Deminuibacter soli]
MKPAFESVHTSGNTSFVVRKFKEKAFSAPFHYHPEFELTWIVQGNGKRYVGTHMQNYTAGDLVMLGANVPHCWKTTGSPETDSVSIVVHFRKDFLGAAFFHAPEMNQVLQLLQRSNEGLHFTGNTAYLEQQLKTLLTEKNAAKKLLLLLGLLQLLSAHDSYEVLQQQTLYADLSVTDKERINRVLAYIVAHFQEAVALPDAAALVNMSTHAFCKYFKRITRKTFVEAVNDYRVDFAVKQLVETDKSIAEIGFESGFNDISNFHKTFKSRLSRSPLNYRNTFKMD